MRFLVAAGALGKLTFEASSLLLGIIKLAEGVSDFKPADENFEALDPVGVLCRLSLVFRQRRDGQREVVDERRLDEVRLGYEFKNLCDGLAVRGTGIIGNVRIVCVVALHQRGEALSG